MLNPSLIFDLRAVHYTTKLSEQITAIYAVRLTREIEDDSECPTPVGIFGTSPQTNEGDQLDDDEACVFSNSLDFALADYEEKDSWDVPQHVDVAVVI